MAGKLKNILGKRINSLVAVEFIGFKKSPNHNKRRFSIWKYKCDCGNYKEIVTNYGKKNFPKSCGCLIKDIQIQRGKELASLNKKEFGVAALNSLFGNYKRRAKYKNIKFDLTIEEFEKYIKQNCYYCNEPPMIQWPSSNRVNKGYINGFIFYNGLDRLDSNLGYTTDNLCTACCICNRGKNTLSKKDFENWIRKLVNFWRQKN